MILESAVLYVKPELADTFEDAFRQASVYIASIQGYISHELYACIENSHQYMLLVKWETLEDHTIGFRESAAYQEWKKILHDYYDPFPVVEHYTKVL